jgi:glyoxalase family protein
MTPFRTAGLHHVTLVAREAPRTAAFYGELLGLTPLAGRDHGGDALWFGDAEGAPGSLVAVRVDAAAPAGRYGVGGLHHVAFGTENDETLLAWKRYLGDRGVRVSGPMERGYFRSLYFRDPDGQVLEIATRGPATRSTSPPTRSAAG